MKEETPRKQMKRLIVPMYVVHMKYIMLRGKVELCSLQIRQGRA